MGDGCYVAVGGSIAAFVEHCSRSLLQKPFQAGALVI